MALSISACRDQTPTAPSPSATAAVSGPASGAAQQAQISALINSLFAPKDQGAIQKDFARVKNAVARQSADAEASVVAFVETLLLAQDADLLLDPNGSAPPSTAEALRDLVNSVAQFGGLPPPLPTSNPFADDGAIAVVGPEGGTVVSSSGFGGVGIPPGAFPEDVIVVVARLPDPTTPGTGPLPTNLTQYPLFYDFSTTPHLEEFAVPVTVGICQLEVGTEFGPPTQDVADRLQLAHPNPAAPTTVELLERVSAGFVNCDGVSLAARESGSQTLAGHMLALLKTGSLRMWDLIRPSVAYAVHGGLGGRTRSFSPFGAVDPGPTWLGVSAGHNQTCGLTAAGSAFCWGSNNAGKLGIGSSIGPETCSSFPCSTRPVPVVGGLTFGFGGTGLNQTCGVTGTGVAYCWGINHMAQLGTGSSSGPEICSSVACSTSPVAVGGGHAFTIVRTGYDYSCGLTPAGAAWCWGRNSEGQLGTGSSTGPQICLSSFACSTTPIAVAGGLSLTAMNTGVFHTCGLIASGAAFCWGSNHAGQLGNGTSVGPETCSGAPCSTLPVGVLGGLTFTQVNAGDAHTCGVTTGGAAYCWGGNTEGQLGDGSTTDSNVPVPVLGGLSFTSIDVGSSHTCGVTTTGAAYCWGGNNLGQLGDGSNSASMVPVAVQGALTFSGVSTLRRHTCGLTSSGSLYCWGSNGQGELGNNSTANSNIPVLVVSP